MERTNMQKKQGVSYTQVPPKNEKLWNGFLGQTGVIELLPGGPVTARGYFRPRKVQPDHKNPTGP